jgi:hypothetical protein
MRVEVLPPASGEGDVSLDFHSYYAFLDDKVKVKVIL